MNKLILLSLLSVFGLNTFAATPRKLDEIRCEFIKPKNYVFVFHALERVGDTERPYDFSSFLLNKKTGFKEETVSGWMGRMDDVSTNTGGSFIAMETETSAFFPVGTEVMVLSLVVSKALLIYENPSLI